MDSSVITFEPKTLLQNPNTELHSITPKNPSKRQCILGRRVFKRQSKLISKLERDFQSLLSFSPTTQSNPKSKRKPDPQLEVQLRCSIECHEFLLNEIFDGEGGEVESFEFFRGLFEKDETLRGIYLNNPARGMFFCLVCGGEKRRKIYGSCIPLVQHACTVEKTKKVGAHRAFGRVVCEVFGWDVNEFLNMCKSKVNDKWMKFKGKKALLRSNVATVYYNPHSPYQQEVMPANRSCNGMDLDKNDFQVDTDNREESKGYNEIVEKIKELNFNATFSAAQCNTFQSSTSLDGTNKCSNFFKSATNSLQIMCTERTLTSSHFGTVGPTIGRCIEKLEGLHGLCPESQLFSFACNLMRSSENREIFMKLGDDMARYTWLEYNCNKDGQFKS